MTDPKQGQRAVFRYRVYWEHTDAGGVVYHARYLNFLERARSDWLAAIGVNQTGLRKKDGLIFVVTRMEIDFRKPARLEDELEVSVSVQACGRARMDFAQRIMRDGEVLIDAVVHAACIDAERFKPARIPSQLADTIRSHIESPPKTISSKNLLETE
ncbi:MAG: tol-pal system-associated acyl-CoA thioesterase [Wenzhouxiangellaceae bacterium]